MTPHQHSFREEGEGIELAGNHRSTDWFGPATAALFVLGYTILAGVFANSAWGQEQTGAGSNWEFQTPVRTDSPRDTIETFLHITDEMETALIAYLGKPSYGQVAEIALMSDQLVSLIDLEEIPPAARRETGIETFQVLMDIFGRIGAPDAAEFPDVDKVQESGDVSFRIPKSPLYLVRIPEGEREGEFLFSAATVRVAPRFLSTIRHLPLQSRLGIDNWHEFGPQLTGPLIPAAVARSMPTSLQGLWLDTPAWKVIFLVAALIVLAVALYGLQRIVAWLRPAGRVGALLVTTSLPLVVLNAVMVALPFVALQVNPSGGFAAILDIIRTILLYAACAWLFWLAVRIIVEWIIRSPSIPDQSLDADLLRLAAATVGTLGVLVILALGGQAIGLPILSVVAGLGIGGLAVALAVRPTFENLIGGVILYMDRPVRVGDFCSVGDKTGTVESIGIRSTKLRALDRTVIAIPNAQFADMQIVNWAQCDQMLIQDTIGVRYETRPDQLRFLLVELRRMLHSHPRIDNDTVRVRFSGLGDSALEIEVRVYAETREWNDFFAIREDLYLRIFDIVLAAGTSLAFPSQTLYMARDGGVDTEGSATAEKTVDQWRRAKKLPFPRLTREEIERLRGSLDYPPQGSPDSGDAGVLDDMSAEPLSAPPEPHESTAADDEAPARKM